jgi:intracellular sulfur oxidation DsrE/DsrF family protein
MMANHQPPVARRSFLVRLSSAAAAFGTAAAAFGGTSAATHAQTPAAASADPHWQPARHAQDDWLDHLPGKHRFFFDSVSATGADDAILYANNYFVANKTGYGLNESDLAVVICLRHLATPFAFNDDMWAKYGAAFSERIKFIDPKTKRPAVVNVQSAEAAALVKRGVQFAVCDMATHYFAGQAAGKTGGQTDEVYKELQANTIGNCHFVAAGIVGVNRAQERGYSLVQAG